MLLANPFPKGMTDSLLSNNLINLFFLSAAVLGVAVPAKYSDFAKPRQQQLFDTKSECRGSAVDYSKGHNAPPLSKVLPPQGNFERRARMLKEPMLIHRRATNNHPP